MEGVRPVIRLDAPPHDGATPPEAIWCGASAAPDFPAHGGQEFPLGTETNFVGIMLL